MSRTHNDVVRKFNSVFRRVCVCVPGDTWILLHIARCSVVVTLCTPRGARTHASSGSVAPARRATCRAVQPTHGNGLAALRTASQLCFSCVVLWVAAVRGRGGSLRRDYGACVVVECMATCSARALLYGSAALLYGAARGHQH